MIQNLTTIKDQIDKLNMIIGDKAQIQKIYSTSIFFVLSLRIPGQTLYLYCGRGAGYEGIYWSDSPPAPILRKKDKFIEYLRKYLSSCYISRFCCDEKDRVWIIEYIKYRKINYFGYFYKGRESYFMHVFFSPEDEQYYSLKSWTEKNTIENISLELFIKSFDEIGRRELKDENNLQILPSISQLLEKEQLSLRVEKNNKKNQNSLNKKIIKIKNDLKRLTQFTQVEDFFKSEDHIEKLKKMKEFIINGKNIKFNSTDNAYQKRDKIYQKIKSYKEASVIQLKRLEKIKNEVLNFKDTQAIENNLTIIAPVWNQIKEVAQKENELDLMVYKMKNFTICYGRNARENDYIRKNWANKNDLWVHLSDQKSPHVFVKLLSDYQLSSEDFQNIAKLIKQITNGTSSELNIIYTQVKNLKGVRGRPGMVNYKKEKHLKVIINEN